MEMCITSGIKHIIIVATACPDAVAGYVAASEARHAGVTFHLVQAPGALSAGDALREVASSGLIEDDFVLIPGDVVANVDLAAALRLHQERKSQDRAAIQTVILKEAPPGHRTQSLEDDLTVVLDGSSGQVLHYDNTLESGSVSLPLNLVRNGKSLDFRHDLLDTRIDICTIEVLHLLADNFDWQDVRTHLLRDVLTSEILGYTVYSHIVQREYAARVKDLRTYNAVSRDVLHRWTYPMVPDTNWWGNIGDAHYALHPRNVYKEKGVMLEWTAELGEDSVVGAGTAIGAGSRVEQSVIGRNCRIGDNCTLIGAYLWDGVEVGDNTTVHSALLCHNVSVGAGCQVAPGCMLAPGVQLGPGTIVEPDTKLTLLQNSDEAGDEELDEWPQDTPGLPVVFEYYDPETDAHTNRFSVAADSRAARASGEASRRRRRSSSGANATNASVTSSAGGSDIRGRSGSSVVSTGTATAAVEADEEEYSHSDAKVMRMFDMVKSGYGFEPLSGFHADDDSEDDTSGSEDSSTLSGTEQSIIESMESSVGGAGALTDPESGALPTAATSAEERQLEFCREVAATVHRALAEDVPLENVELEIVGLRLAGDRSQLDCARALLPVLLHVGHEEAGPLQDAKKPVCKLIKRFASLLQSYVGPAEDHQVDVLYELQEACEEEPSLESLFAPVLQYLYKIDVIEEPAILVWETESKEAGESKWIEMADKFLTWLHEAEEESD